MPNDCVTYQNSGYFSSLIVDYLNQKPELKPLYNRFPTLDNFEDQIQEKKVNFNHSNRAVLADVLKKQSQNYQYSDLTNQNIESLLSSNTFTITTGHQLNLFSGPLYFLYKIISAINLADDLKIKYPNYNFVPVYWMATEDHDFEEINYFNFKGKKIRWNKESSGPVGRLFTSGLDQVFEVFANELGTGINAEFLKTLFKKAYLNHNNLADATRYLANALFGKFGLVIIDADNQNLKKIFIPYIKEELLNQTFYKNVSKTIQSLEKYTIQVNPRELNLFYIEDNFRERIIFKDGIFTINNTQKSFSKDEILEELDKFPEKFSPNVLLRPVYQEVILPNLCYIGGGGEIAYWLELKSSFESLKVVFPILLLRNSVLVATKKQAHKADKLNLMWQDLFLKQDVLIDKKIKAISNIPIDFSAQMQFLKKQFEDLYKIANLTDSSFIGAVKAQETKQLKGLLNLEKRLLKAQKRKYSEQLAQIISFQNNLFPNDSLQERQANFAEFYLENGNLLIESLILKIKPLEQNFIIFVL